MWKATVLRGLFFSKVVQSSYLLNGWGKEFWSSARGWTGWQLGVINLNVRFFFSFWWEFFVLHRMVGRTQRGALTPGYFDLCNFPSTSQRGGVEGHENRHFEKIFGEFARLTAITDLKHKISRSLFLILVEIRVFFSRWLSSRWWFGGPGSSLWGSLAHSLWIPSGPTGCLHSNLCECVLCACPAFYFCSHSVATAHMATHPDKENWEIYSVLSSHVSWKKWAGIWWCAVSLDQCFSNLSCIRVIWKPPWPLPQCFWSSRPVFNL